MRTHHQVHSSRRAPHTHTHISRLHPFAIIANRCACRQRSPGVVSWPSCFQLLGGSTADPAFLRQCVPPRVASTITVSMATLISNVASYPEKLKEWVVCCAMQCR